VDKRNFEKVVVLLPLKKRAARRRVFLEYFAILNEWKAALT
jgi:hypothetical protein